MAFDEVSSIVGAKLLGNDPAETMPHSLIIAMDDQIRARKSFNKLMPKKVPRIALVDRYSDEKTESILAAEALGKGFYAVRRMQPSSRRGRSLIGERTFRFEIRAYNGGFWFAFVA